MSVLSRLNLNVKILINTGLMILSHSVSLLSFRLIQMSVFYPPGTELMLTVHMLIPRSQARLETICSPSHLSCTLNTSAVGPPVHYKLNTVYPLVPWRCPVVFAKGRIT